MLGGIDCLLNRSEIARPVGRTTYSADHADAENQTDRERGPMGGVGISSRFPFLERPRVILDAQGMIPLGPWVSRACESTWIDRLICRYCRRVGELIAAYGGTTMNLRCILRPGRTLSRSICTRDPGPDCSLRADRSLLAATADGSSSATATTEGVILLEDFTGAQIFPSDNWWNLDISDAPVDPASNALIDFISGRTPQDPDEISRCHPDFGPPPYGIPYVGVAGNQSLGGGDVRPLSGRKRPRRTRNAIRATRFPEEAKTEPNYIEGGVPGGGAQGDRHLLVIDRDHWLLFETWATFWNADLLRWEAGSGAVFNLATNDRRPEGWTSADAAGLAIFPGLVRYDEVYGDAEIGHAFRFTVSRDERLRMAGFSRGRRHAGRASDGNAATSEAGDRPVRLSGAGRTDLQAMKIYGLILADNGSDMYITGTMDPRWDNDILNPAFHEPHGRRLRGDRTGLESRDDRNPLGLDRPPSGDPPRCRSASRARRSRCRSDATYSISVFCFASIAARITR